MKFPTLLYLVFLSPLATLNAATRDDAILTPKQAAAERDRSIAAALASKTSLSDLFDTTQITGAQIDESAVKAIIRVDPAGLRPGSVKSLAEGFTLAYANLDKGIPTKLSIAPGTYREVAPEAPFKWSEQEIARKTLFIIEGEEPEKVIWSGADVFPLSAWKNEGDGYYSHDWPYQWGFGTQHASSGTKAAIAYRAEQVFISDRPLKPRLLEMVQMANLWGVKGTPKDAPPPSWTYTHTVAPKTVLNEWEFGVLEREENGRKLWMRLPPGEKPDETSIEVSVRRHLLTFVGKENLVIRNLNIVRVANGGAIGPDLAPARVPIRFARYANQARGQNILIERCRFLWNSGKGFHVDGDNITLRDVESSYNGYSGMEVTGCKNSLWIRTTTNFNLWRARWGGTRDYWTGGVKVTRMDGHLVLGHTSLGNPDWGFWHDIWNRRIYMQDVVLIDNNNGLFWELSQGPFDGRRILSANDTMAYHSILVGPCRLSDSILSTGRQASSQNRHFVVRMGSTNRAKDNTELDRLLKESGLTHGFELQRTIVTASPDFGRNLFHYRDERDPEASGFTPILYRGTDNVLWAPSNELPATVEIKKREKVTDGTNRDLTSTAKDRINLEDWISGKGFPGQEINARVLDPGFVDPLNGDFRFRKQSPLAKEAGRYLQFSLSPEQRSAIKSYLEGGWLDNKD